MVEVFQHKWSNDLEQLLRCPNCTIYPTSRIYQCQNGHHMCQDCKLQQKLCLTCNVGCSETRHFLAESLCEKLNDIKLALFDPEDEVKKLLIPDQASVASQTDDQAEEATSLPKKSSLFPAGPYPCRIGNCDRMLYYESLMNHIKTHHITQYMEMPMEGNVFQNMWFFDFAEQLSFDRAFTVPSIGTFFLKLSSDVFGNLTGFVLMVHNALVSRQYTYQMEIACCPEHITNTISYTGKISSCRTSAGQLLHKSLNIKRTDIQRLLEHQNNLTCTVLLSKNPHADDSDDAQKYAHPKKCNSKNRSNGPRPPHVNSQNVPWSRPPQANFQNELVPRPLLPDPYIGRHRLLDRPPSAPAGDQRTQRWRDGSRQWPGRFPQIHTNSLLGEPPITRRYA